MQKLNAFKNLLYYLRGEKHPTKFKLVEYIKGGIYGAKKGKYSSK